MNEGGRQEESGIKEEGRQWGEGGGGGYQVVHIHSMFGNWSCRVLRCVILNQGLNQGIKEGGSSKGGGGGGDTRLCISI